MMRKQEQNDKAQTKTSRSGRIVKKVPRLNQAAPYGKIARIGRWTTNDKQKLLRCLQKYPCSQYNPLTVFSSLKVKTMGQVEEYILKLRKRTADHIEENRKIQPSILTWFQVADEVTWLKDDEDLDELIPWLLGLHAVEANSMQQRNPMLNFSNLYRYLKVLHKSEHLPQLTPAESIVLLDCFQQLADILRASDTEPQAEFMQNQYQKFFQRLYFAASDMTESWLKLESEAKSKAGKTSVAKQKGQSGRKPSIRPLMKAELRKKTRRRRTAGETAPEETTQKDVESQTLQTEVPDGTNRVQEGLEREGECSQEREECQTSPVGKESLNERLDVGGDRVADEVSDDMNNDDQLCHNLDPDDPDFLAKFADMFSLGSLNPFEIPPELMDFRPKPQGRQTANGNVSNQTDGGGTEISEGGNVGDKAIEIDDQAQPSPDPVVDLDHQGVAGTSTAGSNRDQYCDHVNKVTGQEVSSKGMEDQRSHHAGLLNNHLSGKVQSGLSSAHQLQLSSNHLPVVSSDRLPDASSDRLPNVPSDRLPDIASDHLPVVSSDHLPDASRDRLPNASSDHLPVVLSDRLPDIASDHLPVVSSDHQPEVSCSSQIDISSDTLHKTSSDQLTDPSSHHCAETAHQPEVSSVCQSNGSNVILAQVSSVLQTQLSSEQVPEASTTHCHEVPSSHSPEVPSTSAQLPEASTAHCHEVPSSHTPEVPSTSAQLPEAPTAHCHEVPSSHTLEVPSTTASVISIVQ